MVIPLAHPDPSAEARALLHAIIEHGDVVGADCHGRTVIALPVDGRTLDRLAAFDAAAADRRRRRHQRARRRARDCHRLTPASAAGMPGP